MASATQVMYGNIHIRKPSMVRELCYGHRLFSNKDKWQDQNYARDLLQVVDLNSLFKPSDTSFQRPS